MVLDIFNLVAKIGDIEDEEVKVIFVRMIEESDTMSDDEAAILFFSLFARAAEMLR